MQPLGWSLISLCGDDDVMVCHAGSKGLLMINQIVVRSAGICLLGWAIVAGISCTSTNGTARLEQTGLHAQPVIQPVKVEGVDIGHENLFRVGDVYIAGQPSFQGFDQLKELGIARVINLRGPKEMDDIEAVPFDEPSAVEELGIHYVHIPLGERNDYQPEVVETLAAVLAKSEEPVLIHCASGGRASYLWAAYLVRYKGLDYDEAYKHARAMAISTTSFERLLGEELEVHFTPVRRINAEE